MQRQICANDNHGRPVVTVRCCPTCGRVVNTRIPVRKCRDQEHAQARRARRAFCMNCGEQLVAGRFGR
jgi:hypothetical protein